MITFVTVCVILFLIRDAFILGMILRGYIQSKSVEKSEDISTPMNLTEEVDPRIVISTKCMSAAQTLSLADTGRHTWMNTVIGTCSSFGESWLGSNDYVRLQKESDRLMGESDKIVRSLEILSRQIKDVNPVDIDQFQECATKCYSYIAESEHLTKELNDLSSELRDVNKELETKVTESL